jgi:branched chain amino acid efflux pump
MVANWKRRSRGDGHRGYVAGARAAAPFGAAAGLFGVSFGILARAEGLGIAAPLVMSMTVFAGSSQFAAVSVLGTGGAAMAAVAAGALLNFRYGAMGIAAAPAFRGGPVRRLLEAQLLVDESWAIAGAGDGFDLRRMIGAGAVMWVAWVAGTAAGLLGASLVVEPEMLGLDAAFPALFLALLAPRLGSRRVLAAALLAAAVALTLFPVLPAGLPIVVAAPVALLGWWWPR